MTLRLLLVDDHPVVRAGYQRLLEQDGRMRVVAQAGSVDEALARFVEQPPEVTITDLSMPGSGGLELIRRILARQADARVIVFSMHDSELLMQRAFDVGARGFVSKTEPPEALLEAVRNVVAGRRHRSAELGPGARAGSPRAASDQDRFAALTDREFEIFRLLAKGDSAAECARSLHLSPKTVANHQSTIRDKLGVATSAAMAHLALRHGLIAPG